ncbi:MAG: lysostaphin resistance A-like protein [Candidatus Rokuibacteriota bacterium]
MPGRRLGWILAAYLFAFVNIVTLTAMALLLVREMYPDVSDAELTRGLPALLAGGLASATALLLTIALVTRPLDVAGLRLLPGRETGTTLGLMILGTLALGQALDSALALLGLADRGAMALIRSALTGAAGAELFLAVLVIGVFAGAAEEVFFRGYLQTGLREHLSPTGAVVTAALGFALFHGEVVHGSVAFALGLWLGYITERAGSALPAVACHVVNNSLFTLLTVFGVTVEGAGPNAAVGAASLLAFAGCAVLVARRVRPVSVANGGERLE